MIKCPVCRATYKPSNFLECHRCGTDLEPLIRLHDQALWHYNQAIAAQSDLATAIAQMQQAIALNSRNSDFYAFLGQLWGLQGDFQQAIAAWKIAEQLNPRCVAAKQALDLLAQLSDTP
jgi:cytochrome c-type biogenesis protein CcmH/NrfG